MKRTQPIQVRILKAVPFQTCPVCNGTGKIFDGFISTVFQTCRVCNGAMIIPMFVVEENVINPPPATL